MHGNSSAAAEEAYQLLNDGIEHVSKGFLNIYDGKVHKFIHFICKFHQ